MKQHEDFEILYQMLASLKKGVLIHDQVFGGPQL